MGTSGPRCWVQSQRKGLDTVKFSSLDVVSVTEGMESTCPNNPNLIKSLGMVPGAAHAQFASD